METIIRDIRKLAEALDAKLTFTRSYTVDGKKTGVGEGKILLTAPRGKQWELSGSRVYEGVYTRGDAVSRQDAIDLVKTVIEGGYKDAPVTAANTCTTSKSRELPVTIQDKCNRRAELMATLVNVDAMLRAIGTQTLDNMALGSIERMEQAASIFKLAADVNRAVCIAEGL